VTEHEREVLRRLDAFLAHLRHQSFTGDAVMVAVWIALIGAGIGLLMQL
jgi:hypothetical protein